MITALIAAQPKAATTHMTFALARYTGSQFGWVNLYANNGMETQDPNPQLLQSAMRSAEKIIVKPHMQATPNNVNLLAQAGIRPIVMTRDIMDTVVSMRDHFDRIIDPEDSEHMPGDFIPMPLGLPLYQKTYRPLSPLAEHGHAV